MSFGGGSISGTVLDVYIYYLTPSASTTAPGVLNKLVAYMESTTYKVVAIGGLWNSMNKIIEISDATGTPTCKVADMPFFPFQKNIYLNAIVLTNNYVVVTGIDRGALSVCNSIPNTNYACISVGKRSDVVGTICNPTINPNYYLQNQWEANETVIGVSLTGDKIAISYLHPVGIPAASTRLRVIDIPSMTNIKSQQFGVTNKLTPIDMIYMSDIDKVEIVQPIVSGADFIQLSPYSSSGYTTSALIPNNESFKSISTIKYANSTFIATHIAELYIQNRTASLPHSTATCPSDYSVTVEKINNLPLKKTNCDITAGTNILLPFSPFPKQCHILPCTLNTQCFSYE